MKKIGIMICGHGSRSKSAESEFGLLARALKKRFPGTPVEYGFLEFSAPNIHMGLDSLLEKGVDHIIAVPGMLFAATHAKNDIPSVLLTYQEKSPELQVSYGQELGLHPKMISAFESRILESIGLCHVHDGDLYDTMLVVVGRGTSDTSANAEVAKLTRIVTENLGFGWSETVYSGVTFPSVGQGLEMSLKLGYQKIVVAPYFLFSGKLIDRIYNYVDRLATNAPNSQFFKSHYLSDHVNVIDTFVDRINATQSGEIENNCDLMASFKYRLARGEVNLHHHHAEYKPTMDSSKGVTGKSQHNHTHDHKNAHNHRFYKHIGHPNGPRTMIDQGVCGCFMSQFPEDVVEEQRRFLKNSVKKK